MALAAAPDLLVLDDPTLGLDVVARRAFWDEFLEDLADRGTTALVTTHDLAAIEGTDLARRFEAKRARPGARPGDFPVISAEDAAGERWHPYLKEGGEKDFHHPVCEYIDWSLGARASYVIPRGSEFGKPGICVSGVSRRLSAREMPAGCHWDTNKVIGLVPKHPASKMLLLGLLNSDLYTYVAKRMLNASSSLQLSDLWRLPVPDLQAEESARISARAEECVRARRRDPAADIDEPRRALNAAVYEALGIDPSDRAVVVGSLERTRLPHWS